MPREHSLFAVVTLGSKLTTNKIEEHGGRHGGDVRLRVGAEWRLYFLDQIGIRAGLGADNRGTVLSVTSFMGLAVGVVAAWVGARTGRGLPIVIGLSLNVAAAVDLAVCESIFAFSALNLLWGLAYNFLVPYLTSSFPT
jgi:hypothetical protein